MRTLIRILTTVLVVGALSACAAWAQQQTQQPQQQAQGQQTQGQSSGQGQDQSAPIPAYRSPLGAGADSSAEEEADPQKLEPDTRSLAGVEDLTVGAPKISRNYWAPYVNVSSTLDSEPLTGTGASGWTTWTSFQGGIDLNRTAGNSAFRLSYLGGGSFSNDSGVGGNSVVQQLGVSESISFRRYAISFVDQLAYLPESGFGYAGIGGQNLFTGGNLGLQSGFTPEQSILTQFGQRISNSAIVQANAFITPRSSVTFVGDYGTLNFFDNNLYNTNEVTLQAGYNYVLNRKDTIAILYRFDGFRYDRIAQSINDHSVQFSYARRVTGRLAFQLSAGPTVAFSQTPITPNSTSSTTIPTNSTTGKTRQFFWDVTTNLNYALRRTSLQGAYSHGVTGGSGVLAGAVTDTVTGSASRQLTHNLRGEWMLGYSRNRGAVLTSGFSLISPNQTYDYWYTGVNVSRALGRYINMYVSYQVNYQTSNSNFCLTATCGTSFTEHQITLSLGWQARPMAF